MDAAEESAILVVYCNSFLQPYHAFLEIKMTKSVTLSLIVVETASNESWLGLKRQ